MSGIYRSKGRAGPRVGVRSDLTRSESAQIWTRDHPLHREMEPTHFNEVETAHDTVLPAQDITVIGRNFFDTDLLQCKFTACRSNSSVAAWKSTRLRRAARNRHRHADFHAGPSRPTARSPRSAPCPTNTPMRRARQVRRGAAIRWSEKTRKKSKPSGRGCRPPRTGTANMSGNGSTRARRRRDVRTGEA